MCHRNLAMDSVKQSMEGLDLPSSRFGHPVAYTFMYVQWEANRVIQPFFTQLYKCASQNMYGYVSEIQHHFCQIIGKQLVRNMGLAFAVIALVSLLLIADPIVR